LLTLVVYQFFVFGVLNANLEDQYMEENILDVQIFYVFYCYHFAHYVALEGIFEKNMV